ncbi:hypothetical protein J3F84DRAFT_361780 [Trichoderma pleuroticola]
MDDKGAAWGLVALGHISAGYSFLFPFSTFHADVTGRSYGAHQLASRGRPKSRGTVSRTMVRCGDGRDISGGRLLHCVRSFWPWPSGCCGSLAGCVFERICCLARSLHRTKSGRALNRWMDCCAGLIGQVGRRIHLQAAERCVSCLVLFRVPYGRYGYGYNVWEKKSKATGWS